MPETCYEFPDHICNEAQTLFSGVRAITRDPESLIRDFNQPRLRLAACQKVRKYGITCVGRNIRLEMVLWVVVKDRTPSRGSEVNLVNSTRS